MCPEAAEEPSVFKSRVGLFWLKKTETMQDEKMDGDYGLIINGHSLVRFFFLFFLAILLLSANAENPLLVDL